jgi:predicted ATPase
LATTEEGSGGRITGAESIGKPAATGTFAIRGEYWTLSYGGTTFPLKDFKGLSYIQRLLQHPGEEFHSLDLLRGPGSIALAETERGTSAQIEGTDSVGGLGDSGEMLDARAKQEYRRKLIELNEELEDQRERGNRERAEQIASEIDFLNREISRAIGLGGRDRRAGSASERARLNVTRAIKAALQKISEQQAAMGDLLDRSIKTGSFCSYAPDPDNQVSWRFSMEGPRTLSEPEATEPFLFRRGSTFLRESIDQTTFVGRDAERATLRRILERAANGQGSVVMIGGPAGVGKTRIAAEICADASKRRVLTYVGSCYDQEDSVPFIPFVEVFEAALAQAPSPKAFRDGLGKDATELARLLPQLRRLFPDIPQPMELPPEQSRRILFNAVAEVLARTTESTPLLLMLDDLHWADEGTLALLSYFAPLVQKLPILVIGTYRDFELRAGGTLARTIDELNRRHVLERITLGGLPQNAVADMLRALSGREPPEAVVSLFYSDTEGNPFFVEELFRHLVEQGKLLDSGGEFRHDLNPSEADLPQNVRLAIGRRLAKLNDNTQRALATAALIGHSFTFGLLEAATGLDPDPLLDQVEEAEEAGLILSALDYPEARFQFSHELVRRAVLGDLSAPRRQRLHLQIADALERIYAEALEERANELVHHLTEAGSAADDGRTLRFLIMAVKRELEQSASESAARHTQSALALLNRLPASPERDQRELDLQIAYGVAMTATEGAHVREVENAYRRARELCGGLGDDQRLFLVSYGLWHIHLLHAELPTARPYADGLVELAHRTGDEGLVVQAHWVLACNQFFMGEFAAARANLAESIRLYDKQRHRTLKFRFAQDPCVSCLFYDALALWMLGRPEQAEKRAAESLALAREADHPYTLAWCLHHLIIYRIFRHQFSAVEELSREGLDLCKRYGFAFLEAPTRVYASLARVFLGLKRDEREPGGLDLTRPATAGDTLMGTWYLGELADALGNRGKLDKTFPILAEALRMVERSQERYFESEIRCIKGELILKQLEAAPRDSAEVQSAQSAAEESFRNALEIARRRGAKIQELRAATGLSRLLNASGRKAEARGTLQEIYNWFTEGLDTPQLMAAKSLLESLPVA